MRPKELASRRELVLGALATYFVGACKPARSEALSSPVPSAFDVCPDEPSRTLSILTWNIWMMPPWIHESPHNVPRARAIAAALLGESFDIVCLQKVFDDEAREALEHVVAARYPFRYGPANAGPSLELNSGLFVLSRFPLTDCRAIEFGPCSGIECLSRKGAMLLSGRCGDTSFRLVTTHLQGEEGSHFTERNARVRLQQTEAIQTQLVAGHEEPGVPFFFCGDFGTPRFTADGKAETPAFRAMLDTLQADAGGGSYVTLDETKEGSQLVKDGSGRRNQLDYVLVRDNRTSLEVERRRSVLQRGGWDEPGRGEPERVDLSYRYGVAARVKFG